MTVATESFNKSDSTTLGPDQSWTESRGDLQVVGNACRAVSANSLSQAYFTVGSNNCKWAECTVKTFTTPASGSNHVTICPYATAANTTHIGARISIASNGTCTVDIISWFNGGVGTTYAGPVTITKPTAPFTFACQTNETGGLMRAFVNGQLVLTSTAGAFSQVTAGLVIFAQNSVGEVEVESATFDDVTGGLPIDLGSDFTWPEHGFLWGGPFISSAGRVYIVGRDGDNALNLDIHKGDNPLNGFTQIQSVGLTTTNVKAVDVFQEGDLLHIAAHCDETVHYRAFSMSTDAWQGSGWISFTHSGADSCSIAIAKRSDGDMLLIYNSPPVTNMGKAYIRVAARRLPSGGSTWGATTQIGDIAPTATTTQSESAEALCLGTSDRIHAFYSKTSATANAAGSLHHRTILSTDDLDGTTPATATQSIATDLLSVDDPVKGGHHLGKVFMSSGGVLALYYGATSSAILTTRTATSANSPSWSAATSVSAATVRVSIAGDQDIAYRIGGGPWDGTNKYVTWVDNSSVDPMYDKDTGSGWGTDTALASGNAAFISCNVIARGSNVVLAFVTNPSGGSFSYRYDEVFIRSTGTTVGPVSAVAATASVPAPTISASATVSPSAVAATASVPSVSPAVFVTAGVNTVAATASVPAPTISAGANAAVSTVAATASVPAPTISTTAVVTPNAVAATAAVPGVIVSIARVAEVATVAATASVPAVTIDAQSGAGDETVPVNTVVATASVPSVSITVPATALPATVQATASVPSVTIRAVPSITPGAVQAIASVPSVTIVAVPTITPNTVAATAAVPAITISATATVTPGAVAATAAVPSVTVQAGSGTTVSAGTVAATAAVPAITIRATATVTPNAVAATAAVPSVIVRAERIAQVNPVAATASVPAPTISATATVTPGAVAATASVPAAVVSVARIAVVNAVAATATVPAVTINTTSAAIISPVAAVASVPSVVIQAGAGTTVAVNKVSATAAVPAPTIQTTATVTPNTVAASAAVPSITISASGTVPASVAAAVAAVQPVTITHTATVVVAPVAAVAAVQGVSITVAVVAVVAPVVATAVVPSVVIATSSTALVAPVAATAAVPAIIVILGDQHVITSPVYFTILQGAVRMVYRDEGAIHIEAEHSRVGYERLMT